MKHSQPVSTRAIRYLAAALTGPLLAVAFTLTTAYAQIPDTAKMDRFFDRLSQKNKAMGSVLLTGNGRVIYNRIIGYGLINSAEKQPLTAASGYRIGSVTKMFTAAMVFQLIEAKKLKESSTLSQFFPQIPHAEKITITHLLAHRSGLADIADGTGKTRNRTQSEILETLAKSTPLFEPDARYEYSNAGYVVLGYIIEKVTGKPYPEALQQMIAAKAGLTNTYGGTGLTDLSKNECYSYLYAGGWHQQPGIHLNVPGGAGSVVSTPADLVRFVEALFKGKLISPKNLSLMKEKKMAMDTFTYNGKVFYGHTGGIDNFGAWLMYQPEEQLAFAYTTNAKVYPVRDIVQGIFELYAGKPFDIPTFDVFKVAPEVLEQYTGIYTLGDAPAKFTVSHKEGVLYVQMNAEQPVALEATAINTFKIDPPGIVLEFDAAKKQMKLTRNGRERVFTKAN